MYIQAAQKSEFLSFGGAISYPRRGSIFLWGGRFEKARLTKKNEPPESHPPPTMSSVRTKRQKKDVTTPVKPPPAPVIASPYNMEKEAAPWCGRKEAAKAAAAGERRVWSYLVAGWRLHFLGHDVSMKFWLFFSPVNRGAHRPQAQAKRGFGVRFWGPKLRYHRSDLTVSSGTPFHNYLWPDIRRNIIFIAFSDSL